MKKIADIVASELDEKNRRLLKVVDIETRKGGEIVVRYPLDVHVFNELYEHIAKICQKYGFSVKKADKYPTLAELGEYVADVQWLWEGWIPYGFLTLLVGDPGSGKSMVALDWVKRITRGISLPMTSESIRGNVLWIEAEAAQQLLIKRAKNMGIDMSNVYVPLFGDDLLAQPDLLNEDHCERIVNIVQARKPLLVVVDSLSGAHTRGENKVEEMRPILSFLATLARDNSTAVLAIHHLNKIREEDIEITLYRVRGSSQISAFARSIIAIERMKDTSIKVSLIKSNLAPNCEPMIGTFERRGKEVIGIQYSEYVAPQPKRTKTEKCADWLWELLSKADDKRMALVDIVELGAGYGYTRQNLYSAKDILGDNIQVYGTGNRVTWAIALHLLIGESDDGKGEN